ncbi:DUF1877 family protein [Streptomyces albogriseolus]|uniref:DUF1877 family protein n=1 Tax=Streptomyces albogriseolus TaxID=1887 RepID=UPI003D70694C
MNWPITAGATDGLDCVNVLTRLIGGMPPSALSGAVDLDDAAADVLGTDADRSWTLPIYGGRPVPHSADADPSNPPLMLLEPPEVSQAADFLAAVSFDQLWNVARARIMGPGWDEAQARQEFLSCHRDLQRFYGRAASAGHAVVKAVWA